MSEGLINLVDDDSSSHDVGPASSRSGLDDHLATTKLPAQAAPPSPGRRLFPPQAVVVPPASPAYGSSAQGAQSPMLYPSEPPPALPRTSWWRSLIASTLSSPAAVDERLAARWIGVACAGLAPVLVIVALVVGLREPTAASSPVAAAAM